MPESADVALLREIAAGWVRLCAALPALPLGERVARLRAQASQLYAAASEWAPPPRARPWTPTVTEIPKLQWGVWADSFQLAEPRDPASLRPLNWEKTLGLIEGWTLGMLEAPDDEGLLDRLGDGFYGAAGAALADLQGVLHRAAAAFQEVRPVRPAAPSTTLLQPARGFLGLRLDAAPVGVEVVAIHPGGPAAGLLQLGDYLVAADDTPLSGLSGDHAGIVLSGEAGEIRTLEVLRGGTSLTMTLRLAPRPAGPGRS